MLLLPVVLIIALSSQVAFGVHGRRRSNSVPTVLNIVHLGDSFSSGSGARNANNGTAIWIGPSSCYRSPYNWGQQCANALSNDTSYMVNYTNRACAGATIMAVDNVQRRSPMIPAQIDSVHGDVDYVPLSFGANDLGYLRLVLGCYMIGLRDVVTCREEINTFRSNFLWFRPKFVNALLLMEGSLNPDNTNPNAKIVIVSYPHTVTDTPYYLIDKKFKNDTIDISTEIRRLFVDADMLLYGIIQEVNDIVGREYVVLFNGTKRLFHGHEPDPSYGIENPNCWFWEFHMDDILESYHINPTGHTQLGKAVSLFFKEELLIIHPTVNEDAPSCTYSFSLCALWGALFRLFPFHLMWK